MGKQTVAIVTSAASDIPPELVEKYKITILPVLLNFEDKSYKSFGIEKGITWDEYYKLIEKEVPSTGIPGPGYFVESFKKAFEIADAVIGIFISKKMSAVYNTAVNIAATHFKDQKIAIFDDGVTGVGTATLVIEASKLIEQGKSFEEVTEKLKEWIPDLQFNGIMNTLENLVRTGRISKTKKFFADILKFKPVCGYLDGEVHVYGNIRAEDELIIEQMKKYGVKALENINPETKLLFVGHTRWPEVAEEIAKYLQAHNPNNVDIKIQETGVINSFYTGKKLLIISYIGKFDANWLLQTK
ncbi:MAG: DegV family protein [Candidatus Thorarchaeota archaeon]